MISAFYPFTRSQITKNKLIRWWLNPMRSASCLKRCSFPAPPLPPGPISLPHRSVAVPENWGWRHGESHGSYGKICCKLSKPCVFFSLETCWKQSESMVLPRKYGIIWVDTLFQCAPSKYGNGGSIHPKIDTCAQAPWRLVSFFRMKSNFEL